MNKKIFFASSNKGKIKELNLLFNKLHYNLVSFYDFKIKSPNEPYNTFLENALLKARNASRLTKLPSFSDDSGLCVPSIDFRPGVKSSVFAGKNSSDEENMSKLLSLLKHKKNKAAFFYCVIVYVENPLDNLPKVFDGFLQGRITSVPKGKSGFGYDPIFFIPKMHKTLAELTIKKKNTISHRGKAINKFLRFLKKRSF